MNVNWGKIAGFAGIALSLGASLITKASEKKELQEAVKKEVEKALSEK